MGMSSTLASSHSMVGAAESSGRDRATASMPEFMSRPRTRPVPMAFAARHATTPVPQATSSTRSPGCGAARRTKPTAHNDVIAGTR
jgi:hypothetical protein